MSLLCVILSFLLIIVFNFDVAMGNVSKRIYMKSSYMLKGFKSTVGPKDIPTCKQEGGILIFIIILFIYMKTFHQSQYNVQQVSYFHPDCRQCVLSHIIWFVYQTTHAQEINHIYFTQYRLGGVLVSVFTRYVADFWFAPVICSVSPQS